MLRGLCLAFALALALVVSAPARAQEEPLPGQAPGLEEPPPSPTPPPPGAVAPPAAVTPPALTPAQPVVPAKVPPPIQLPPSLADLPVESGRLDSHVDLQFLWSHVSISSTVLGKTYSASAEGIMLGLEGQYAFADLFEVGLTMPFLLQSWLSSTGATSKSNSQFGNLMLDLKLKVLGRSNGPFALSLFANWILPTASGADDHSYAALLGGVAASGALSLLTLGGALTTLWAINGKGTDLALLLVDLHLAARFHRVIGAYFLTQIAVPVYPDQISHDPVVALGPGVQVFPLPAPIDGLHLDLGVRIAVNSQPSTFYTAMSRVQLTFAMGYAF